MYTCIAIYGYVDIKGVCMQTLHFWKDIFKEDNLRKVRELAKCVSIKNMTELNIGPLSPKKHLLFCLASCSSLVLNRVSLIFGWFK